MCSQLYDATPFNARNSRSIDSSKARPDENTEDRRKLGPAWLDVAAVDPATLRRVADGNPGLLRFFDLANVGSVSAILTGDLGVYRTGPSGSARPCRGRRGARLCARHGAVCGEGELTSAGGSRRKNESRYKTGYGRGGVACRRTVRRRFAGAGFHDSRDSAGRDAYAERRSMLFRSRSGGARPYRRTLAQTRVRATPRDCRGTRVRPWHDAGAARRIARCVARTDYSRIAEVTRREGARRQSPVWLLDAGQRSGGRHP